MVEIIVALTAMLGGIVQGVTGFGTGVIMMMILPHFFSIMHSAGISVAICISLTLSMVIRYRRDVEFSQTLLPTIIYIFVCGLTIHFSTNLDPTIAKRSLGAFLLTLSIYYLFFEHRHSNQKQTFSAKVRFIFIVISAVCDGLFGIGGPLMVLYFLSTTRSIHGFLGTLQLFFFISASYSTIFRVSVGILTSEQLIFIGVGTVGVLSGLLIANRIVDRLNAEVMKKLTYIMIGVSGLANLF